MLERASEAIDLFPRDEREFGALTLCIDEALLPAIRERVQTFRQELMRCRDDSREPTTLLAVPQEHRGDAGAWQKTFMFSERAERWKSEIIAPLASVAPTPMEPSAPAFASAAAMAAVETPAMGAWTSG
jgi:hypothetical protein